MRKGPVRSLIAFAIPFFNASAPPFGMESLKNAMLCGPPDTFMNRTVVPALMVSVAGSNAAFEVPSPVIFTSTTAPAGSAAGVALAAPFGDVVADIAGVAGVAASACAVAAFLSPPQAIAPNATSVVSRVNRIADSFLGRGRVWACESVHNIFACPQNGSPERSRRPLRSRTITTTLQTHVRRLRTAHARARARPPPRRRRATPAARRASGGARRAGADHPGRDARLPRRPRVGDVPARHARTPATQPGGSGRGDLRARQLEQAGDSVLA